MDLRWKAGQSKSPNGPNPKLDSQVMCQSVIFGSLTLSSVRKALFWGQIQFFKISKRNCGKVAIKNSGKLLFAISVKKSESRAVLFLAENNQQ